MTHDTTAVDPSRPASSPAIWREQLEQIEMEWAINAVRYARAQICPRYGPEDEPTPYEKGMIQTLAATYRDGYLAAVDALRACAEARPSTEPGWQPIETAPKDGRKLIVLIAGRTLGLAWWGGKDSKGEPTWWAQGTGGVYTSWNATDQLTHWMPLPVPPRAAAPQPEYHSGSNEPETPGGVDVPTAMFAAGRAAALDAAPSLDLWQTIYDAAANEGSILHDDTVSAIDSAIRAALARSAPAETVEAGKEKDDAGSR